MQDFKPPYALFQQHQQPHPNSRCGHIDGGRSRLRPSEDIDKAKLVGVHSITRGPHGVTIRMHDKIRALELLAKHLGMFREEAQVDLEVRDGSEIVARMLAKLDTYSGR